MFHNCRPSKQRGSSLVIAIFVLVILFLLAAALIKINTSSANAIVYEVMGTRAMAAAQSGANRQLQLLFPHNSTSQTCASIAANSAPTISDIDGLNNCAILLPANSCQDFVHDGTRYYTLTVTGQCAADGVETSRTIKVDARSID